MGLVIDSNLPSSKAKSTVEVEVYAGNEFIGHLTEVITDHTRLNNLNGDENFQHINAEEKVAVQGLTNKSFGYKFDGVDDKVLINHNNLLNFGSSDFTIEAIIKPTAKETATIVSKTGDLSSPRWYFRISNSGKNLFFTGYSASNVYTINAYIEDIHKKNNHIVLTRVGDLMRIYNNGELLSEKSGFSNQVFDNNFSLAAGGSISSELINGDISLFRIYKRGFDQYDVDYYYNAGRPDLSRLSYSDKVNKTTNGCVLELLPENATQSKWLDTQNGLDGITTGNPTINYGNCTPEPYVYPFKKYIGLEQNGNGTGFARFSVTTNKTGKAIVSGGIFVDSTGLNEIGKELTLYKDIQTNIYVKLLSQFGCIEFDNLIYFSDFAKSNNDPIVAPFTSELPIKFASYGIATTVVNKLYGNVSLIPRSVVDLRLSAQTSIDGLTTGDYKELPRGLEYLFLNGTKIFGNLSGIPRKVKVLYMANSTGISGLIKDIPDGCTRLTLSGTNTVSGNLSDLKGTMELITLYGINVTYSGNLKFSTGVDTVIISPTSNVFTSTMVDQLLIDLAAQVTTAIGSKTISLTGNCGAPTAASSDARAKLSGLGFTIMVN